MAGYGDYRNASMITLLATIAVVIVSMGGCGSTQQADRWVDPSYKAAPLKKVLVVAMRQDPLARRMWEDAIAATLGSKEHSGTIAVASYQLFPKNLPDTLAVRVKTKDEGFDGVLLVAKALRDTLTNNVAGYTTSEPVTSYYSRRWNAYVTHYEDVYHPGYTETETAISVRTDLIVPQEDGKLVWSVTSRSVDPTSADEFRKAVAGQVVKQLKSGGFTN